jgi:hypothetical protein
LLEQSNGCAELLLFVFGEAGNGTGKRFYAPIARFPHEANAFGGRFEANAAAVFGGVAADQSCALETGDDAAHCWRTDLLSVGKFAERFGAAEDEDREGGKLGGADAGFAIANTEAAEQVDGDGVKLVGDFGRGRLGRGADRCAGNLKRIGAFADGGDCGSDRRS